VTLLYYNPRFLDHDTGAHPECAERLQAIVEHLKVTGLDEQCTRPNWSPICDERMARVHSASYTRALDAFAQRGGGHFEPDTVLSRDSFDVARLAAGAVVDASERVVRGQDTQALCLVRPPGHHALKDRAMGFCLLNNVALAATTAQHQFDVERVLIVDWDVHHGNGTQAAFWTDAQVGFLSIHRWPFYPGTGAADETGSGPGLGTTLNLPIRFGTPRQQYHDRFRQALEQMAAKMRPQLVLISAGFDSHRADPIGSLGLEVDDFARLTTAVLDVAAQYAGGRVVSVLEGGYNPVVLAQCVEVHLRALLQAGNPGD